MELTVLTSILCVNIANLAMFMYIRSKQENKLL